MLYFYKQIMRVFYFIISDVFLTILERVEREVQSHPFLTKKKKIWKHFKKL